VRHGGLADADDTDLLGFDQAQPVGLPEGLGQRAGGHPARRAASNDDDVLDQLEGPA
jgi:hypothetical protein